MNDKQLAQRLLKLAGSLLGPGIPDGTGPMGGTPECPMSNAVEEPVEADPVEQILENQEEIMEELDEIEDVLDVHPPEHHMAAELVKIAKELIKEGKDDA